MNPQDMDRVEPIHRDKWMRVLHQALASGRNVTMTGALYEPLEYTETVEAEVSSLSFPDIPRHVTVKRYASPVDGLTTVYHCDCPRGRIGWPCSHTALVLDELGWFPFSTVREAGDVIDQDKHLAKLGADLLLGKR